jgi:hypothetical protein
MLAAEPVAATRDEFEAWWDRRAAALARPLSELLGGRCNGGNGNGGPGAAAAAAAAAQMARALHAMSAAYGAALLTT